MELPLCCQIGYIRWWRIDSASSDRRLSGELRPDSPAMEGSMSVYGIGSYPIAAFPALSTPGL